MLANGKSFLFNILKTDYYRDMTTRPGKVTYQTLCVFANHN